MTISVPIPTFKMVPQHPKVATHIRIVPHPTTRTLSVTWEETTEQPTAVPVQVNSQSCRLLGAAESVTRTKTPLELRLDPTL